MKNIAERSRDLDKSRQTLAGGTSGAVTSRLTLERQVIRVLTDSELGGVAGGATYCLMSSIHTQH
jgi:hypothetical protein